MLSLRPWRLMMYSFPCFWMTVVLQTPTTSYYRVQMGKIFSTIDLSIQHLLSIYSVSGTVPGTKDSMITRTYFKKGDLSRHHTQRWLFIPPTYKRINLSLGHPNFRAFSSYPRIIFSKVSISKSVHYVWNPKACKITPFAEYYHQTNNLQ